MRSLTITLVLTLVLATVAFAGETNAPPCVPGETSSPPCASLSAPGQTDTPPAADSGSELSITDLALEVIELALLF